MRALFILLLLVLFSIAVPYTSDSATASTDDNKAAASSLKRLIGDREKLRRCDRELQMAIGAAPKAEIRTSETIKYENDEQILVALASFMHRQVNKIIVQFEVADTQNLPAGVLLVYGLAMQDTFYCPPSGGVGHGVKPILAAFMPEDKQLGETWRSEIAKDNFQFENLISNAKDYRVLIHLRSHDGRHTDKIEFRRIQFGTKCQETD